MDRAAKSQIYNLKCIHLPSDTPATMAGTNLNLKTNQLLFKEGDPADGMYLVRKGELCVFLEKNSNQVRLASISAGGMIGEMAFFDKKPRSASVKATADSEVTKISEEEFKALMKQIPKWFVGIMSSLSTRLRETNDRLQTLENKSAGIKEPLEDFVKALNILVYVWHKEGTKDEKKSLLGRDIAEKAIVDVYAADPKWVTLMFDTLIVQKFFTVTLDNYKKPQLSTANKASITSLVEFTKDFLKNSDGKRCLDEDMLQMLRTILAMAKASPYESPTIGLNDLIATATKQEINTDKWTSYIEPIRKLAPCLQLTKASDGIGLRVIREDLPKFIDQHLILAALAQAGV